jgi:hypothetical protein
VVVDPTRTYQTMQGFGGAITDASASVLYTLPAAQRAQVMASLFSPTTGDGLDYLRQPIGGSDTTVLVAHNENDDTQAFAVQEGQQRFTYTLPGDSLATFVWNGDLAGRHPLQQVDFGQAIPARQVVFDTGASAGDYPRGYAVQTSANGTDWNTVVSNAQSATLQPGRLRNRPALAGLARWTGTTFSGIVEVM